MIYRSTSKKIAPSKTYWSPPKDTDPMVNKNRAIYWFQCGDLTCNEEYIGETSRTFGERFKEHLKEPSPIHHHSNNTGLPTTQHSFQIIGREGHDLARNIKESIFIRVNNPTLNRNIGRFNLPHILDRVLIHLVLLYKGMHKLLGMLIPTNLTPHPLNQPNFPTHLGQPNFPMQSCNFLQVLSILIEPIRTDKRCSISVLPQTR